MKEKQYLEIDPLKLPEDSRSDQRQSVLRSADLVINEQKAPIACLVKDVSQTGFKLIYDSPHKLPERVTVILHHPKDVHECEVMWQKDKEIGLRILEA